MRKHVAVVRHAVLSMPFAAVLAGGAVFFALSFAGCDRSEKPTQGGANPDTREATEAVSATTSIEAPAPSAPSQPKAGLSGPARVSDAAQQLDLSTLPMMQGAEQPSERAVTALAYRAPGAIEAAFKFHQDQLRANGWGELPGSSVIPQAAASGTFAKGGMHLSLSAIPDKPGTVSVSLRHHGNIDFSKLPLPAGAKPLYAGPLTAIYLLDQPVDAAAAAIADGLVKAGWTRFGSAGPTAWFKQNAMKISAMTSTAPAQGGKTTVNFGAEMLPVDVPTPDGAEEIQFSNSTNTLSFQTALSQDDCVRFYREALGKAGWTTKMEAPTKIDANQVIVFRNAVNDMLEVAMRSGPSGGLRVAAKYRTATEIAEMNRKLDAQAEAYKARKAAEGAPQ